MTEHGAPFDLAALYGEDHVEAHAFAMHGLASGRGWCALSLGGHTVLRRKEGEAVPNEDALCIVEAGERVLLAVADGHFGHNASHGVIARLAAALDGSEVAARAADTALPCDIGELTALVLGLVEQCRAPSARSAGQGATTLLVAVLDRAARAVFGVTVGDSSAVAIGVDSGVRWLSMTGRNYLDPSAAAPFDPARLATFQVPVVPGDLLVVFTDGVNECQYGSPATSIGPRHLEALAIRSTWDVEAFVEALAALALEGVDGHPGGEDNLALAATRA
jgi:hypothetical protein